MVTRTQVYTPKQKLNGYRLFRDQWAPYLKGAKHCVMQAIFGHTVDFGKIRERITIRHLIEGLGCIAGLPYCERTIRRTLDALTKMQAILRRRTREGYEYSINLFWNPGSLSNDGDDMAGLAIPKNQKNVAPVLETEEHEIPAPIPVQHDRERLPAPRRPIKNVHSQPDMKSVSFLQSDTPTDKYLTNNSDAPSAFAIGSVSEESSEERGDHQVSVVSVSQKNKQSVAQKIVDVAKKALQRSFKDKDLFDPWKIAFQETFPEAVISPWGMRDLGMAKKALSEMRSVTSSVKCTSTSKIVLNSPLLNVSLTSKQEFLVWCVQSWPLVMATRFTWMNKGAPPPKIPSISFLYRFREHFYEAFNDRDTLRNELKLNPTDYLKKKMMDKGATVEEAQAEIDARDAHANRRSETSEMLHGLNERLKAKEAERAKLGARPASPTPRQPKTVIYRPVDDWDVPEDV